LILLDGAEPDWQMVRQSISPQNRLAVGGGVRSTASQEVTRRSW
jgi:hypothetical protein